MKVTTTVKNLLEGFKICARTIKRKSPLPILNFVHIHASDRLSLTASTLDNWSTVVDENAEIESVGAVCLTKSFLATLKTLPKSARITLEADNGTAFATVGGDRFGIECLPAEEFPEVFLPTAGPQVEFELPEGGMKTFLNQILVCVANSDESRAVMTHVHGVWPEGRGDSIRFEATDGRRAVRLEVENYPADDRFQTLFSRELFLQAEDVCNKKGQQLARISCQEGCNFFQVGNVTLGSREGQGIFVNIDKILNDLKPIHFYTVDRLQFIQTCKRLLSLPQEKTCPNAGRLNFSEGFLSIGVDPPGQPRTWNKIPCSNFDGCIRTDIGLNLAYAVEWAESLQTESLKFSINTDRRPMEISGMIIMPIALREEAAVAA